MKRRCDEAETRGKRACEWFRTLWGVSTALSNVLGVALIVGGARADVVLPAVLSDHMVMQRSDAASIWGTADAGEKVTVTLAGQVGQAVAGPDGKWQTTLNLKDVETGPHEMMVKGSNELRVGDVMIGEVWVASGQSNMQFTLRGAQGADAEMSAPINPMIRHFKVPVRPSLDPMDDCEGKWEIAGPDTVANFTAVGYFFAKALQKDLGVPVGILDATLGGTAAESWTSQQGMRKSAELAPAAEAQWKAARDYPELRTNWEKGFAEWIKATDRADRRGRPAADFAAVDASLDEWKSIKLPGKQPEVVPGVRWFRRTLEIPGKFAGRQLPLVLGEIEGFEEVYWNGELIGQLTPETHPGAPHPRRYDVPANLVKAGTSVLAIRVFSPATPGGMAGRVFKVGTVPLMGEWLTRVEYEFPGPLPPAPPEQPPGPRSESGVAASLFNGMIHPLLPYTVKGVIWYQGEGNASRAWQYRTTFPNLIRDWRSQWKQPDLPFYFCQLANHGKRIPEPSDGNWAELREAQTMALELPHTGQAILTDLGEAENVHPQRKKEVGERLAKIALAKTYGRSVLFLGPVLESSRVEAGKMRLRFRSGDGVLVARPLPETYELDLHQNRTAPLVRNSPESELEGFAVSGKDGQWVWAQARIEGNDVVVWSDKVPEPTAVRFAWADNPIFNLYGGSGLPVGPFRTDDFPLKTEGRKYQP